MDTRSRYSGRHRSPYKSRSRTRSPSFGRSRRGRRSRSRERLKPQVSPLRERQFEKSPVRRSHDLRTRLPSLTPPRVRDTSARLRSGANAESNRGPDRLHHPEIQSTVHPVSEAFFDMSTFVMSHPSPPSLPLTERFDRLTNAGTAVYNGRTYRRPTDSRHIPHLIITNNTKLPPATLVRQAKAISIVIKRKLPVGKRRSGDSEPFDPKHPVVNIPRRLNEGSRPVFDRPEIKFYLNVLEEGEISKRLLDCVSSSANSSRQPAPIVDRRSRGQHYRDVAVVVPGRFYGSRVDEQGRSRFVHPLDPSETPRNSSYFLHDDREAPSSVSNRRDWSTWSRYRSAGGFRREPDARNRSRSPPPSYYHSSPPASTHSSMDSARWQHDKFEQLLHEETGTHTRSSGDPNNMIHAPSGHMSNKPLPKPVPAPKPILWSTIGNDMTNGQTQNAPNRHDYTPQSSSGRSPLPDPDDDPDAESKPMEDTNTRSDQDDHSMHQHDTTGGDDDAEDVRIEAEPVLDYTIEG